MLFIMFIFGHSFVKRAFGPGRSTTSICVDGEDVILDSFGEGGLTLDRVLQNPSRYIGMMKIIGPRILILDLGTNDLCSAEPTTVLRNFRIFFAELRRAGVAPTAIFLLPVLPRTKAYAGAALSLSEFNLRVERLNKLLFEESLHTDMLFVWEHRSLSDAPHHIFDGVHLDERGRELYRRTLRRIGSFSKRHFWE